MSVQSMLQKTLSVTKEVGITLLKTTPLPLSITEDHINDFLAKKFPQHRIHAVRCELKTGYVGLDIEADTSYGPLLVHTKFTVMRAIISGSEQRLVLKLTNPLTLTGLTWYTKIIAWLHNVKQRRTPTYTGLQKYVAGYPGLYFNNELCTIDLAEMGFSEKLIDLVRSKVQTTFPKLSLLASPATHLLLEYFSVESIVLTEKALVLNIRYTK